MNVKYFSIIALVLGTSLVTVSLKNSMSTSQNLIPREVLFGNQEKKGGRISPDGRYISYLAEGKTPETRNVLNVWVMPVEGGEPKQVTFDTSKGIFTHYWRFNSEEIFYVQDEHGDENWQIFGVALDDLSLREYTPAGCSASILAYKKQHPDRMLVGLNERNPSLHDVFEIDLNAGKRTLVQKNNGAIIDWLVDNDLNVRGGLSTAEDGGFTLYLSKDTELHDYEWEPHFHLSYQDYAALACYGFNKDGSVLYFKDAADNDTAQLIEYNIKERERKTLFTCPMYDVSSDAVFNEDTGILEAVAVAKERLYWHVFDPTCQQAYETIAKAHPGDPYIVSRSADRTKWLIAYFNDASSVKYYLYDAEQDQTCLVFSCQPALDQYQLAPMKPVSFVARDGLQLHGYLTLPVGVKSSNLPLILVVHGGPWARDSWGYDPEVQWLANRGYAVLQINYRGSLGYGKKFVAAAHGEWGRKMHYDLLDGVQWAIDQKIADPDRIAIYGASFGGYAALCGATMSPDRFKCAVDIFGISNIITWAENFPPYWDLARPWFYEVVGHPERDKKLLLERSPVTHVEKITCPLLIAQGTNDARVPQSESEQIVAAMKAKGISHEYLLFENEGHGFRHPENNMKFYAAAEKFLAEHLGGRCES